MRNPIETQPLNSNSKSATVSKKLHDMLLLCFPYSLSLLTDYLSKGLEEDSKYFA